MPHEPDVLGANVGRVEWPDSLINTYVTGNCNVSVGLTDGCP